MDAYRRAARQWREDQERATEEPVVEGIDEATLKKLWDRNVRLFLDLSTDHLPRDPDDPDERVNPNSFDGVTAYRLRYGWLMWVPDDPDESAAVMDEEVPPEILTIQRYARRLGCDYVLFDDEARQVDDLPIFA
jgi:hypothetical protein